MKNNTLYLKIKLILMGKSKALAAYPISETLASYNPNNPEASFLWDAFVVKASYD